MRNLKKRNNKDSMTLEAYLSFSGCAGCYCRCGCEHASGSENLGMYYANQDVNSTYTDMVAFGFFRY